MKTDNTVSVGGDLQRNPTSRSWMHKTETEAERYKKIDIIINIAFENLLFLVFFLHFLSLPAKFTFKESCFTSPEGNALVPQEQQDFSEIPQRDIICGLTSTNSSGTDCMHVVANKKLLLPFC